MDLGFILVNAITVACIYGLIAVAVSITWSSLGLINLGYGFVFSFAGYGAWVVSRMVSESPAIVAAAGLLTGALGGILICLLVFIPLHDKPNFTVRGMIGTLAISLLGSQALLWWFGPRSRALPELFGYWQVSLGNIVLTADKIGDEFDIQYLLKTSGDSYKRSDLIAGTGAALIVPVDFPEAPEVDDILDTDAVSLEDLKHWELAPFNPRLLAEAGLTFALTSNGAGDEFWSNLRLAVANATQRTQSRRLRSSQIRNLGVL